MQTKVFTEQAFQQWNDFITDSPWGDILQFWQWGETKRVEGWEPHRIGVLDGEGNLKLAAQAMIKPASFLGNYLYVPHGPVFHTVADLQAYLPQLVAALKDLAAEHNCFVIEIEPKLAILPAEQEPFDLPNLNNFLNPEALEIFNRNGFRRTGRNTQPVYKLLYDLSQSNDELLAGMQKNTRYNVGYAERKGVKVESYTPNHPEIDKKILEFYDSLKAMQQRTDYPIRPLATFQSLFNEFKGSDNIALYCASFEGDPIVYNISERTKFWSSSFYAGSYRIHSKVKAPYLLRWQSIQNARDFGSQVYDFWGIIPDNKAHAGYSDHKLSFGGVRIDHVGLLSLPINMSKYLIWDKGLPLRNKAYKLLSKFR